MRFLSCTCLFFLLLPSLAFSQTDKSLKVEYIGNMGVLISGKKSSVLIDGLHSFYKPDYLAPPSSLVDQLIANDSEEYPPIQLVLNTHIHGDHFDPKLVHRFLTQNPEAMFMGSTQAEAQILEEGKTVEPRLHAVSMDSYDRHPLIHGEVGLSGFYLNHGYAVKHHSIENIGFLIHIEGKTVLHVGDTEWYEEVFSTYELPKDDIDVAILPYWMLMGEEAKELVDKWIGAEHVIGTHIPPTGYEESCEEIRKRFPDVILFTEIGQYTSHQ